MESLVKLFGEHQVILFFLLFARISGLFAFFPFFSHANIPLTIKTSMTFFMVIFLFPLLPALQVTPTLLNLTLAIVGELLIGFVAGLFLTITISILQMAGMQISFIMGFTMASVIDPQTSTSIPILSQNTLLNWSYGCSCIQWASPNATFYCGFTDSFAIRKFLSSDEYVNVSAQSYDRDVCLWIYSFISRCCFFFTFRCCFWNAYENNATI